MTSLPTPALAGDQHGGVRRGDLVGERDHVAHGRIGGDDFARVAGNRLDGVSFACTQISGWYGLNSQNVYFTGRTANAAGSFFFMLTWLHLMHIAGGFICLIVTAVNAARNKYSATNYLGVKLTAVYWHFLGILWVYLFLFLSYMNR